MMSLYPVHVLYIVTLSRLLCVSAFAAFVPESNDVIDDVSYDDISKQESQPLPDGQFYKMLSKILMGYLNRIQQRDLIEDYITNTGMPYYSPSKRNSDVYTGFAKRKVFWQPLGYDPTGGSGESRGSSKSRGNIFRYG